MSIVDTKLFMLVGGFRSFDIAEHAVSSDGMDYISIARPLIR